MAEEHEAQWYEDEEPREYDVGEESHSGAGNDLHLDRLRSRSRRAPPDHRRRLGLPSRGRRVDDEIVDARRHGRQLAVRAPVDLGPPPFGVPDRLTLRDRKGLKGELWRACETPTTEISPLHVEHGETNS